MAESKCDAAKYLESAELKEYLTEGDPASQEMEESSVAVKGLTTSTSTTTTTNTTSTSKPSSTVTSRSSLIPAAALVGGESAKEQPPQLEMEQEVMLSEKNSVQVLNNGNTIQFVIYPTDPNCPAELQPTRISYTAAFWLKLVANKDKILEALDKQQGSLISIYRGKHVHVTTDYDMWWANIVVYTRKGAPLRDISVYLREAEFRDLMVVEPQITALVRRSVAEKRSQAQKRKSNGQPLKKDKVLEGNFFIWQCQEVVSHDFFFSAEDARTNAMQDSRVAENKENLAISSVKMAMPPIANFLRYAYLFCLRRVAEENRWGLVDGVAVEKFSLEAGLDTAVVPGDWMWTFYQQFFLTAGVPAPSEGPHTYIASLECYVGKKQLCEEAAKLKEDNSSYNLLCRYILPMVMPEEK